MRSGAIGSGAEGGTVPAGGDSVPADVVGFLASTELFRNLDEAALRSLAADLDWVVVRGGEAVCSQGQAGSDLFLVASGKLRVFHTDGDGVERAIREIGRGENFGEMGLLTGAPRSATVRAIRDSVLVRLTEDRFLRLLEERPAPMLSLTRMLARWLERANDRTRGARLPTTIAVRAASPGVPLDAVTARLARALGDIGSTLHLRAAVVDEQLGAGAADEEEGGEGYRRVTRWLSDREAAHPFVLYQADGDRPAWGRRCARQADRLVTVALASDGPAMAVIEPPPPGSGALTSLVLIQPADADRPTGTAAWPLDRFDTHHHVRLDRPADFGRLARHLTGNAISLVFGGGGANGFAHLGVVRAMRVLGLPIDRIGGTSIGAVMAALVAMGLSHEEIIRLIRESWAVTRPERDFTLPLISLLTGRKATRLCEQMFGGLAVEDLWIPCFCCSANLTRSELVVHRRGPLWRHTLASVAIPGIAPPVVAENGDLLVDGGVLNNVPADVMMELGGGRVIAVDVAEKHDLSLESWGGVLPTPWRVLRNLVSSFSRRRPYPGIFRILMRSTTLSGVREAGRMREKVDLYLEPSVRGYDLFDWNAVEAIEEAGYSHAIERIRSWAEGAALVPLPPASD